MRPRLIAEARRADTCVYAGEICRLFEARLPGLIGFHALTDVAITFRAFGAQGLQIQRSQLVKGGNDHGAH